MGLAVTLFCVYLRMMDKRIRLKKGVYWEFNKQPYLLISVGIGGGKTILNVILAWVLPQIGYVEILDPKRFDFMGIKGIPFFEGCSFWEKKMIC